VPFSAASGDKQKKKNRKEKYRTVTDDITSLKNGIIPKILHIVYRIKRV